MTKSSKKIYKNLDTFSKLAKASGFRSRSAIKLLEIQKKATKAQQKTPTTLIAVTKKHPLSSIESAIKNKIYKVMDRIDTWIEESYI